MKFIYLSFFMFSSLLWASEAPVSLGHDSPSGVLLEKKMAGGYVRSSSMGWERGVILENDGTVRSFSRENSLSPRTYSVLEKLNPSLLQAVKSTVNKLRVGEELRFPDGPRCMDAPFDHYKAVNNKGEEILFFANRSCQDSYLGSLYARYLKVLLEGIEVRLDILTQSIEDIEL